ncbi:VanZ family protein [Curvibacter sp. HBC61]|uniref:VanZ family protein n=1 Tax=Curvibacter cyanobacteriorum TaxID=3026422 RepID=A0ABT5N5Q4_9BURK|nr:VanZ family protein [Curvibacter sp. HBC61]MDD0840428.1 VanZ family protein [Curvibacter sp. HBC61]
MSDHKSSAWPLALFYAVLIVYASLYPFGEWRTQGISPLAFLSASLPQYWTGFDILSNALGYGPLGFLITLGGLRTARSYPVWRAVLASALLSLCLEALQSYLPSRVPSHVDLGLNIAGGCLGAVLAWALEKLGALDRWSRFRARWFMPDARDALVLLALWPVGLLFPAAVPLGLGQVMERVEEGLADWLADTPLLDWLPVRDVELQPLIPSAELLCVALGALVPCLLGYSIIRSVPRRAAWLVLALLVGVGTTGLSAALSYGPSHAWSWLSLPVQLGLVLAVLLALPMLWLSRRGCATLCLLALGVHLSVLNQSPTSAYFAQTLQTWEQGRFIRFHGLAQWVGWLWPFAVLASLVHRLSRREPPLSAPSSASGS